MAEGNKEDIFHVYTYLTILLKVLNKNEKYSLFCIIKELYSPHCIYEEMPGKFNLSLILQII